jgi:hypothetical protein
MGHTAFGLADEYECFRGCTSGETDRNNHPASEPGEVNVTTNTNRATLKWRHLVADTTAIPTTRNADCTRCDPQASPVPAGTVGLFEGAHYYHCGAFRPEFNCRMRALNNPFCAVCRERIRTVLEPMLPELTWHHNDLVLATGAPIAVGDPAGYQWDKPPGSQHVVYRGADGHIHELWLG